MMYEERVAGGHTGAEGHSGIELAIMDVGKVQSSQKPVIHRVRQTTQDPELDNPELPS